MYKEHRDYIVSGRVLNEIDKILEENGIVKGYSADEIAQSLGEGVDEALLAFSVEDWKDDTSIQSLMSKLDTDLDTVLDYIAMERDNDAFADTSESFLYTLQNIDKSIPNSIEITLTNDYTTDDKGDDYER